MEKYGFVYIWYDRKHRRYYVGCHWGREDDGYVCSSPWMMQAYRIRPGDFRRKIIKRIYTSRTDTFVEEQRYLNMIKPEEIKIRYYNLCTKNNNIWSKYDENIKKIGQKISIKTKEAMARPEVRARYEEGLKTRNNRADDPTIIAKKRASMKRTLTIKFADLRASRRVSPSFGSEEYIENMRRSSTAMWARRSSVERNEIGRKISESNLGKKMRLGQTNSEEHRRKISESLRSSDAARQYADRVAQFKWWNDGLVNRRSEACPGENFVLGKLPHKKKSH